MQPSTIKVTQDSSSKLASWSYSKYRGSVHPSNTSVIHISLLGVFACSLYSK